MDKNHKTQEPICIDTKKIYDSCRDKECISDVRVYLTRCSNEIIDRAISVKPDSAELLYAYIDVEPIQFDRGFYTVDVQYFYRVTVDAFCGIGRPQKVTGLAFFQKRTILYGSEGSAKIFTSQCTRKDYDVQGIEKTNMPQAVVEVVDPIVLSAKLVDKCECLFDCLEIPHCVSCCFDDEIDLFCDNSKKLFVTLGQFSIIRLERDIQIVIPQCDICMPQKECLGGSGPCEDPCDLFERFAFPVDQFFPPSKKPGYGVPGCEPKCCSDNEPRQDNRNCRR